MKNYQVYIIKKAADHGISELSPIIEIPYNATDGFSTIEEAQNFINNDGYVKNHGNYIIVDCQKRKVIESYP